MILPKISPSRCACQYGKEQHLLLHCRRWQAERLGLLESLHGLDVAMNPTGEQGLSSALPPLNIPLGQVDERTNAPLICHLLGGRFRETDASMDTIARRSRKTWLDGDFLEADKKQSSFGSRRERPEFIQVATYLPKNIPHRQSYVCRRIKRASAKADRFAFNRRAPKGRANPEA
jgi:hypothetical protein